MTEARRFLFGSVPVYNPQSLSKGEAIAQFHAREGIYQTLLGKLREERPSHVLIIGTRGMGKTTLLQRVRFGVEDCDGLSGRYLPLTFPEEQYNVSRLHHFLLNTVDALADALEQQGDWRTMEFVEGYAAGLNKATSEEIEEKVPKFLAEMSEKLQRGFLLLVDNADRLFETIEDREQWRLREMLSHRSDLTFFGATTQASEGIYGRERAFFEFFRIQRLAPLSLAEVRSLLLRLSEAVERPGEPGATKRRVQEWLEADAGRLRTLVQLTGGNPRTTVLLFHLVLDGLEGGAREYLEQLLDQCTPNYKGRVDDLPTQAQQVLDALALRWDPATAMEIADDTGLETSAVSTQLTRLVRQGLLEKVDPCDSKKALYQVAERFFNIWYLMRASRRARTRLRWFVEFLRVFYESGELEQIALERVDRFRRARRPGARDIENIAAYAFASGGGRQKVEAYLRRECADREAEWKPYFESSENDELETGCLAALLRAIRLDPDDDEIWELVEDLRLEGPGALARSELAFRNVIDANPTSASRWSNLGQFLRLLPDREKEAETALRKALELDPTHTRSLESLGVLLATVDGREQEAEKFLRDAIQLDPESSWTWGHLGEVLRWQTNRLNESEAALRKALELDPECQWVWATLGDLLSDMPGREGDAEEALRKALELDPRDDSSWQTLYDVLGRLPGRQREVEEALRAAISVRPDYAWAWGTLGLLLWTGENRGPEAEAALRRAVEIDAEDSWTWGTLGLILRWLPSREQEAEVALRTSISLDSSAAFTWGTLGGLLAELPNRQKEAEEALRRAIELDPDNDTAWGDLGELLRSLPNREAEAEAAFLKATEVNPKSANNAYYLGQFLAGFPARLADAQRALSDAVEIDPTNANILTEYGFVLACRRGQIDKAEAAFRRAIELDLNCTEALQNLGILLFCEGGQEQEGIELLRLAYRPDITDPVSADVTAVIRMACAGDSDEIARFFAGDTRPGFWNQLLEFCSDYAPFGKILLRLCNQVLKLDRSHEYLNLYRAVALAQIRDFPRALVALEDALVGDPIDLLARGRTALEIFFAAAVRNDRIEECLEILSKKDWIDAWRPIYEALKAVAAGSGRYLKKIAVEIREPARLILKRIAPELPGLSEDEPK